MDIFSQLTKKVIHWVIVPLLPALTCAPPASRLNPQGCLNGTSLACSPDGSLFATGSNSGVVNLYSRQQQEAQRRLGQRTVFGEEEQQGSWAMPEAPVAGGLGAGWPEARARRSGLRYVVTLVVLFLR